jgi:trk system potassium uptake protein TrkH
LRRSRWAGEGKPRRSLAPAELFVGSFFLLVLAGTLSLRLLPGIYVAEPLGWNDAAFTATSAVCVTGLIVVDTATYFTFWGQALVLLMIQLGGLGMLVLTSVIITALGGRPSLRTESLAAGSRPMLPHVPARRLIIDVVRFTAVTELLGAVGLYAVWAPRVGWREAVWPAVFHSISAFCNAGFSTNTLSLIEFSDSPATIIIVSLLVMAGGIGFVTMEEIFLLLTRKRWIRGLSVHSKLVLTTSGVLLGVGWLLFAFFEWHGVLARMSVVDKLCNAFFMSVTPRTAGFNTIDYGQASDSANFLTIILMMIGGSPGSTAGGMKTTTFALMGLLAWSRLRSQPTAVFAHRSIPEQTIQRATGLFVIFTGVIVVGLFCLTSISQFEKDQQVFQALMFETVSAFNTVGLSTGITPELSHTSRWILVMLMFVGRTGPLAIASALQVNMARRGRFRLAYEDVVVG